MSCVSRESCKRQCYCTVFTTFRSHCRSVVVSCLPRNCHLIWGGHSSYLLSSVLPVWYCVKHWVYWRRRLIVAEQATASNGSQFCQVAPVTRYMCRSRRVTMAASSNTCELPLNNPGPSGVAIAVHAGPSLCGGQTNSCVGKRGPFGIVAEGPAPILLRYSSEVDSRQNYSRVHTSSLTESVYASLRLNIFVP